MTTTRPSFLLTATFVLAASALVRRRGLAPRFKSRPRSSRRSPRNRASQRVSGLVAGAKAPPSRLFFVCINGA